MAEQGFVTPETVIHVLKTYLGAENVKVSGYLITVITGANPRVYQLSKQVTRGVVQHIAARHGVPPHLFWRPEMMQANPGHRH